MGEHSRTAPAGIPERSRFATYVIPSLVLLCLVAPWLIQSAPWDPDESRYLEIGREMVNSGDWLVPSLDHVAYLEKPPLYIWLVAASFRLFGIGVLQGRLVSVLSALGAVVATAHMASLFGGRRSGVRAGLVLASCPLFLFLAMTITVDMTFACFETAAIAALCHAELRAGASRFGRTLSALLAWEFLALAFLTKGPVALVIPFFAWLAARRRSGLLSLIPPGCALGLPIFFLTTAPWFIAVSLKHPQFLEFFFVRGHLDRAFGGSVVQVNLHSEPFYYYLPILIGGAYPWVFGLVGPVSLWRRRIADDRASRIATAWLVLGLIFFSAISGKLPTYVLPLFPAVAILATRGLHDIDTGTLPRRWQVGIAIAGLGSAVVAFAVGLVLEVLGRLPGGERSWCIVAILSVGVLAWIGVLVTLRRASSPVATESARSPLIIRLVAAVASLSVLGPPVKRLLDEDRSFETLALAIDEVVQPDDRIICHAKYFPILSFRLAKPIFVIASRRELAWGSEELGESKHLFLDMDDLRTDLLSARRVFLTLRKGRMKNVLRKLGQEAASTLHMLGVSGRYLLVSNRAEPWPGRSTPIEIEVESP